MFVVFTPTSPRGRAHGEGAKLSKFPRVHRLSPYRTPTATPHLHANPSMFVLAFAAEAALVSTSTKERRVQRAKQANSWQNRLDKALLDVDTAPKARVRLLQRALKDRALQKDVKLAAEEIREKGMGKGHVLAIDLLFPTGTTARSDLEGLLALRKVRVRVRVRVRDRVRVRPNPNPPNP